MRTYDRAMERKTGVSAGDERLGASIAEGVPEGANVNGEFENGVKGVKSA